jgi:hypothetical protein
MLLVLPTIQAKSVFQLAVADEHWYIVETQRLIPLLLHK